MRVNHWRLSRKKRFLDLLLRRKVEGLLRKANGNHLPRKAGLAHLRRKVLRRSKELHPLRKKDLRVKPNQLRSLQKANKLRR